MRTDCSIAPVRVAVSLQENMSLVEEMSFSKSSTLGALVFLMIFAIGVR